MVGFGDVKVAEAKGRVGISAHPAQAQAGVPKQSGATSPINGSVEQRVGRLIADASSKHKCKLTLNQSDRSREQAQQFHVCHMFLYNMFKHLRPKNLAADMRTISWEHLSDPKIEWVLISDRSYFLRTAAGNPAKLGKSQKDEPEWEKGSEPDKAASIKTMAAFLKRHHVASMAAPGVNGCGEPCSCGGLASKHVSGAACDIGGLKALQEAVEKEKGRTLDDLLHEYGLFRPMAKLPGKRREEWHVEAYDPKSGKTPNPAIQGAGHQHAKHAGLIGLKSPGQPK
jgi:hypothetical protein